MAEPVGMTRANEIADKRRSGGEPAQLCPLDSGCASVTHDQGSRRERETDDSGNAGSGTHEREHARQSAGHGERVAHARWCAAGAERAERRIDQDEGHGHDHDAHDWAPTWRGQMVGRKEQRQHKPDEHDRWEPCQVHQPEQPDGTGEAGDQRARYPHRERQQDPANPKQPADPVAWQASHEDPADGGEQDRCNRSQEASDDGCSVGGARQCGCDTHDDQPEGDEPDSPDRQRLPAAEPGLPGGRAREGLSGDAQEDETSVRKSVHGILGAWRSGTVTG